jgi:hypothetical protein
VKVHSNYSSKIKFIKKTQNSKYQGFSYYSFLTVDGSPGSVQITMDPVGPKTYGSGSTALQIKMDFAMVASQNGVYKTHNMSYNDRVSQICPVSVKSYMFYVRS